MSAAAPVRVLYVINDLARAGAETQLVELALRLDRGRFEPRIVLLKARNDFAEALARAGIPVVALGRRGWWDAGVAARLARAIRRWRPDVVHAWLFLANLLASVAVPRRSTCRLVLSQRCSYESTAGPLLRAVARWSHRRADRLLVNSGAAVEEEVAAGHPRRHILHIPNGVALTTPSPASRAELGLPEGPLVLALGQLERIKGHHVLLAAWARVREQVPAARLVLVGSGPRRGALEGQARRLGVQDTVTLLGFRAPAAPLVAAADVFVQPSLTEGMPNSLLEAMALARPVVATAAGGIPEVVEDGVSGILVPAGDHGALASAIGRLLSDRPLARRLGEAARERIARHFAFDRVVAETESLYASLAAADDEARARAAAPTRTGPTVTP